MQNMKGVAFVNSAIRTASLSLAIGLCQCQRTPSASAPASTQPASDAQTVASTHPPQATTVRLVSLSPAITRTLVDFHLESNIVGRTPHCYSVDKSIPVVGDLV